MNRPLQILSMLCFLTSAAQAQETRAEEESRPSLGILAQTGGPAGPWKSGSLSITAGEPVRLKVDYSGEADKIRWYQIIPDTSKFYKNANHPWEENAYRWVGFGTIDYTVREIEAFRDLKEVDPLSVTGEHRQRLYRGDLGSFWFQVKIHRGSQIKRSAGVEENNYRNLHPDVFRVTVEAGDDYLGHLTGYFNVPGLFGSIPYQGAHYIGVDCADVLVAAYHQWKGKPNTKDYNVDMLVGEWPKATTAKLTGGQPDRILTWHQDVKPGDLIAVKYQGRNRYQHIGSLYRDDDGDGVLDPDDLVLHAGPEALHLIRLSRGSFDGEVVFLRPE